MYNNASLITSTYALTCSDTYVYGQYNSNVPKIAEIFLKNAIDLDIVKDMYTYTQIH